MKIVATPEVIEFIRGRGGTIFVWTVTMAYGRGSRDVFAVEASTESPGPEREFLRFAGEGIEVLFDPVEHGTPDALHFALKGHTHKRVTASWNGKSYGSQAR